MKANFRDRILRATDQPGTLHLAMTCPYVKLLLPDPERQVKGMEWQDVTRQEMGIEEKRMERN